MSIKVILVIDDEPGYRDMIYFEFSGEGYKVLAAASGAEALDILGKNKVDLVVTDMKMYPMDGLDTMRAIRKVYPAMPVVLMTGYAVEDRVQAALEIKASTCLRKPFEVKQLREAVETAFA